jgi:threonine dehydratase
MNPPTTFASVLQARTRLAGRILETPLIESPWLSSDGGARVWLKLECLQHTRSFKIRGALNAVIATSERAPGSHVVTASAGNHGLALAHAARMFGLPCTIFTPANAARRKLDAIRDTGATLNAVARDYDEAEGLAKACARQEHAEFISPYDHKDVIAGGGTIALEIVESNLEPDVLVVPVGGGGLISGIATVAKAIAPRSRVVGVEAALNPAFATARAHGRPTPIPVRETLADGLGGNFDSDSITFPIVQRLVDDLVQVDENEIAEALRALVLRERVVVEGAGACGAAAVAARRVPPATRIVVVLSGANIDPDRLKGILELTSA